MPRIDSFRIFAAELPFRKPFRHAAAVRSTSSSLFLECRLDDGTVGYGESLPREYVTGESRDGAIDLLQSRILPRLVGVELEGPAAVRDFLSECDGKAPTSWVDPKERQTAAWCAVDLALLDAFGRAAGEPAVPDLPERPAPEIRYSSVVSSDKGWRVLKTTLPTRAMGLRSIKLKVDDATSPGVMRLIRWSLGHRSDLRADANMGWTVEQAERMMPMMARFGVRSFEQPIDADDLEGMAYLVQATGLDVMADESLSDRESLERLTAARACTAVNIRISKCGGLVASLARCREALAAGLTIQVGCQVGESSLASAAHLALLAAVPEVRYAEGCFGRLLLREDPVSPILQFGRGGRPPDRPSGGGLGVTMDLEHLRRHCEREIAVQEGLR